MKTQSKRTSARVRPPAPDDPVTAYARAVDAGAIVAGRLVRMQCARHLRDLGEGPARGLTWSPEHAQHAIDFFHQFLVLPDGQVAGQPFTLLPFAAFIVGSLFGWLRSATGYRRYRTAFVEMGKGAIKTPLAAGIGLYMLMQDGEEGAQVFCAAKTRDQASLVFKDAVRIAGKPLKKHLEILSAPSGTTHNIAHLASGSFFRPVSAEAGTLEGKRVHCALVDELQVHPNAEVVDAMRDGTKARVQSLIFEICNAGFSQDAEESVCWAHHEYSVGVLEGAITDDSWFAYICQLDVCAVCRQAGRNQVKDGCSACDDWRDERVWLKTNPALPHTPGWSYLRQQVTHAIGMPSKRSEVLRKNFCVWTQTLSEWLPLEQWLACSTSISDAELYGAPCFAGLDLGMNDDFSAYARVWMLPDGRVAVRMRYWIPNAARGRFPKRPYAQWIEHGELVVTEGNTTDYDVVEREAGDLALASSVREFAYDDRFAEQIAQHLQGRDLTMVTMPQGYALTPGLRAIEKLVADGQLCHGGDPILAWMVSNVMIRHGQEEQIRIEKDRKAPEKKVDGVDALAMALCRAILQPAEPAAPEVYAL